MSNIYFYKMTTDNGGAPCIKNGLLSLAICKPIIRCGAETGSLVFGFAANSLHSDNRLIYIAVITAKIEGEYYTEKRYSGRDDRIYVFDDGRFKWRPGALYHGPSDVTHDLGEPPDYERARVLLSDDFRYFGGQGDAGYKCRYERLTRSVEKLGQGHRIKHGDDLRQDLSALKQEVWKRYDRREIGHPSSGPQRRACQRSRSCGVVSVP